jgi:hypothetical protein
MLVALLLFAVMPQATAPATGPASATAPATAPEASLSAESFEKLRKVALSAARAGNLEVPVMKTLGLGKDGDTISVKQLRAETALGLYVFSVPVKPASDAVLLSFRDPSGVTYTYLSDSQRALRAAMESDADGNRALTKEEAAEGFKNSLKAWSLIAPRVKAP